jgi:hypothetical protein
MVPRCLSQCSLTLVYLTRSFQLYVYSTLEPRTNSYVASYAEDPLERE